MKTYATYEYHIEPETGKAVLDSMTVTSDKQNVLNKIRLYQNADSTFKMNVISNGKTVYSK